VNKKIKETKKMNKMEEEAHGPPPPTLTRLRRSLQKMINKLGSKA